jgi:hypothetical protein
MNMEESQQPTKPTPSEGSSESVIKNKELGRFLEDGWDLFKSNAGKLIGVTAIPLVAEVILISIFYSVIGISIASLVSFEQAEPFLAGISTSLLVLFILFGLLIILAGSWGSLALTWSILNLEKEKDFSIIEAYSKTTKILLRFILLTIVISVLTWAGLALFIIPGLIIAIFVSVSGFVLVDKKKSVFGSIKESFKVVSNNFVNFLIKLSVVLIATAVITIVLILIPLIGPIVATLILTPMVIIYLYLLYQETK